MNNISYNIHTLPLPEEEYAIQEADMEIGTVKIADEVVAQIAVLAAQEVEGVGAASKNSTSEFLSKAGRRNPGKGVRAQIDGHDVKVELALTMGYGYNIPATCERVQKKVTEVVENMTGLNVTDVDVRIAGVTMPQA